MTTLTADNFAILKTKKVIEKNNSSFQSTNLYQTSEN